MDMLILTLRVALALGCVLGLLWFASRRMSGSGLVRRHRAVSLAVVGKQSLGGKAGVALVEVGGRRLLLGVSEHGVSLLTELEVEPVEDDVPGPVELRDELDAAALDAAALELSWDTSPDVLGDPRADDLPALAGPTTDDAEQDAPAVAPLLSTPAARTPAVPKPRNPLEGSILHAATWRQAMVAVQERTLRH